MDIIRRIMEKYFNLQVVQVMCITDIDDKIIAKCSDTSWPFSDQYSSIDERMKYLTKKYEMEFVKDLTAFNIILPDVVVRVTDSIPEIVAFIKVLLDTEYAYCAPDGSIYFDTKRYGKYGKLRHVVTFVEGQEEVLAYKRSLFDFALWKAAKPGEPYWETNVGICPGRPGWHIECSAIASKYFGESVDLHSGGIDLLYPHNENEESQCCAYHRVQQWVNYWLHFGHLHISDGVKMSKSLGNAVSVEDFLRTNDANHLRMFCLLSPYYSFIEYSENKFGGAVKMCNRIRSFYDDCQTSINDSTTIIDEPKLMKLLEETKTGINAALCDNFDTPKMMQHIEDLMLQVTSMLHFASKKSESLQIATCPTSIAVVCNYIRNTMTNFGITIDTLNNSKVDDDRLKMVVDRAVLFRSEVRSCALQSKQNQVTEISTKKLLDVCDSFRNDLRLLDISVKVIE